MAIAFACSFRLNHLTVSGGDVKEVLQRLGYVLYRIGSGVAGLLVLVAGGLPLRPITSQEHIGL